MAQKPMQNIAFISDIHGNYLALERVIGAINSLNINQIYFLGDAVGYLPYPNETIHILKNHNIKCIKGNHELMLLGIIKANLEFKKVYKLDETRQKISQKNLSFLDSWSEKLVIKQGKNSLLGIHATTKNPFEGYLYPDTNLEEYSNVDYDIICMGHTHYVMKREHNKKLFINAGSVGLPRDNIKFSSFAIINIETFDSRICRIQNDLTLIEKHNKNGFFNQLLLRKSQPFGDII